ncbi:hypothetical protein N8H74_26755, partial [Pseudomonas sp. B2M1-30]|uniref:hypothetical protein n=1 Tax=Pseudomonas TaxID=286 RepID=UPI0021C83AF6
KPFGLPFWRLKKVTRRKGETASRNTHKNGYSPQTPNPKSLAGPKAATTYPNTQSTNLPAPQQCNRPSDAHKNMTTQSPFCLITPAKTALRRRIPSYNPRFARPASPLSNNSSDCHGPL